MLSRHGCAFTHESASDSCRSANDDTGRQMPRGSGTVAGMFLHVLLAAAWIAQGSPTQAGLRGLAVVSPEIVWASGTGGTWLLTRDGGAHWQTGTVAGGERLDFRDVAAWDDRHALLLASGDGANSRVYQTKDGGGSWQLLFTNPDPKGFFDAFTFRDRQHGLLLGDPVDGRFVIFSTSDGGRSWQKQNGPAALPGEGAFAASGTALVMFGKADAWFGTGGGEHARVFHSTDLGRTWTAADTPLAANAPAAGIFSVAFRDGQNGVAVGGNYKLPNELSGTLAFTLDGGRSWHAPHARVLSGYRSAVAFYEPRSLVAVGTNGSDVSEDGGAHWQAVPVAQMNAVGSANGAVWAVGAHGAIARLGQPK